MARVAVAAPAAVRRAEIAVPPIGKDDVETYAKKAADLGIVPNPTRTRSTTRRPARLVRDRSAEAGTKVEKGTKVTAARLRRASRRWSSPTARTSCASTAPTGRSWTRSPTTPSCWRRTRRGTPTGTHVAYTADGRMMLKDITKENADAVPLSPAGSDDSQPRVGADRRHERDRDVTRATAGTTRTCASARSRATAWTSNCIIEPNVHAQPRRRTGRRTASRSSAFARQERPRARLRDRALEAQGRQGPRSRATGRTGPRAASSPTSSARTRS